MAEKKQDKEGKISIPKFKKLQNKFVNKYFNGDESKYRFLTFGGIGIYFDEKTNMVMYQSTCRIIAKTLDMHELKKINWTWGHSVKDIKDCFISFPKHKFENMFFKTENLKKLKCQELETMANQDQLELNNNEYDDLLRAWVHKEYKVDFIQKSHLDSELENLLFGITNIKKVNQLLDKFLKDPEFKKEADVIHKMFLGKDAKVNFRQCDNPDCKTEKINIHLIKCKCKNEYCSEKCQLEHWHDCLKL